MGRRGGEKVRDTYNERNTKFCGMGGRRKHFQRRDPLLMREIRQGLEGRMDISDREKGGGQEVAENEDDR